MTNIEKLIEELKSANKQIMWDAFRHDTCPFCGNTEAAMNEIIKCLEAGKELAEAVEKMDFVDRDEDGSIQEKYGISDEAYDWKQSGWRDANLYWRNRRDKALATYKQQIKDV